MKTSARTGCVVIKLGGSLSRDALLPAWLQMIAECGVRNQGIVVVPGGGPFADQAREAQAHWRLDDLVGHNMAVLGMAQTGLMMQGLAPALRVAHDEAGLRAALAYQDDRRAVLWLPLDLLRDAPDAALTHWGVTSDTLALELAPRLDARLLVVVKSCAIEPDESLADLSACGVLDAQFARRAQAAGNLRIDVVGRDDIERVRGWLDEPPT